MFIKNRATKLTEANLDYEEIVVALGKNWIGILCLVLIDTTAGSIHTQF